MWDWNAAPPSPSRSALCILLITTWELMPQVSCTFLWGPLTINDQLLSKLKFADASGKYFRKMVSTCTQPSSKGGLLDWYVWHGQFFFPIFHMAPTMPFVQSSDTLTAPRTPWTSWTAAATMAATWGSGWTRAGQGGMTEVEETYPVFFFSYFYFSGGRGYGGRGGGDRGRRDERRYSDDDRDRRGGGRRRSRSRSASRSRSRSRGDR